jgi:hypothetical protein
MLHSPAPPLSADRVSRSEFDDLLHDTRVAFLAARHEIESLRQECSTNLRRCGELRADVDRLIKRLSER